MAFLETYAFLIATVILAFVASVLTFVLIRRRSEGLYEPGDMGLMHVVTIDTEGWRFLGWASLMFTVALMGTSVVLGIDYWTGLAIESDLKAELIDPNAPPHVIAGLQVSWLRYATVGVSSFFVLAIGFEVFSDAGLPLASGLSQRKKTLLRNFCLAATAGCIVMSLATKWGYYDDKADVRRKAGVEQVQSDQDWHIAKDLAFATMQSLAATPSEAVADLRETAANDNILAFEVELAEAKANLDEMPETHTSNRVEQQRLVTEISDKIAAERLELAAIQTIRDNLERLSRAEADYATASAKVLELAGIDQGEGKTRQRIGDSLMMRLARVGLHQFLLFLFPLITMECFAAYRECRKRDETNARRREREAEKRAGNDSQDYDGAEPQDPKEIGYEPAFEGDPDIDPVDA